MSKEKQHFGLLLDASGSMSGQRDKVIKGVNEYLDEIKNVKGRVTIASIAGGGFSHPQFDIIRDGKAGKIEKLADKDYKPDGGTPLYMGLTKMVMDMEAKDGAKTLIIDTDGMENTSGTDFSKEQIRELVDAKQKENWTFVFLGEGIDAWGGSASMGFNASTMNTRSYDPKDKSLVYTSLGKSSATYATRSSKSRGTSAFWDGGEKELTPSS